MANGDNNNGSALIQLAKTGTIGTVCAVLFGFLWVAALKPAIEDRKAINDSFIEGTQTMKSMSEATQEIKKHVREQTDIMENLYREIENQTGLREVAMDTMSAFADEMRSVNPANGVKLDMVLRKIDEDQGNVKLDIIIKKISEVELQKTPPISEP